MKEREMISASNPQSLAGLGLTTRVRNSLQRHGISTIEELTVRSSEELRFDVRGLGPGGIKQINAALAAHGFCLALSTYKSR